MANDDTTTKQIETLFSFFEIPSSQIYVDTTDDLISVTLDVPEVEAGRFIGRYAATLDSLQLIISMMVNPHGTESHYHVLVDVGGYRARRLETLKAMVDRVSADVLALGEPRALPPLSATERRQIHLMLGENAKLTTFSQGEGQDRRIFIAPRTE